MKGSLLLWWGVPTDGWNSINTGIIKDCIGNLIVAYAGQVEASAAIETELLAFIQGIKLVRWFDINGIVTEGDCSALMHMHWIKKAYYRGVWCTDGVLSKASCKREFNRVSGWDSHLCKREFNHVCSTLIGALFLSHTSYIHSRIYLWMSLQLAGRT